MILKCRITRSCGHRFTYMFFEADERNFIHRMRSTECDDCGRARYNPIDAYGFYLNADGFMEPDPLPMDDFDVDNLDLGELIDG